MERLLEIEVRFDVPRASLVSTFALFSKDCPEILPSVVLIRQAPHASPDQECLGWLRRQHIPCWYEQNDADGLAFAPINQDVLVDLDYQFDPYIRVIGPS